MKKHLCRTALLFAALFAAVSFVSAQQKAEKKPATKQPPVIFAVLGGGTYIEPIATLDKGVLTGFSELVESNADFHRKFYRRGTKYSLILGGTVSGTVTVKGSDQNEECSSQTADVSVASAKAKVGSNHLALATTETGTSKAKFFRRELNADEKEIVEKLVLAEFSKHQVKPVNIQYRSLLAIDRDHDGKPEFVGTVWASPSEKVRVRMFFIAEADAGGKHSFGHSSFDTVDEEDTMGGDLAPVDEGVGSEMFLESLEFDGDDANEIFTYTPTYEGAIFKAYGKYEGKWEIAYETYSYRCAF